MEHKSFLKKPWLWLFLIVVLASFLIFFRLNRADIQADDAIYSFRAIGYFDFVDSVNTQTTPIVWFSNIPWWSKLSFHDAPPLVFMIQHLFFKVFGISNFTAKLPFALAGVGSVILLYFLVKQLYGEKTALLASLFLAVFSYFSWISRIGYLEGISIFFIILTLLLFLLSLKNNFYFIFFGLSLGLCLLTKYVTLFIIPVVFFYLLFKERKQFISRYLIAGMVIAFLVISPVVFYNIELYQTRQHFDLQFSQLFRQDISNDWPIFAQNNLTQNHFNELINIFSVIYQSASLPVCLALLACFFYFIFFTFLNFKNDKNFLVLLALFFIIVQFMFIGAGDRYLSIISPFLAIILAWGVIQIYQDPHLLKRLGKKIKMAVYFLVLTSIIIIELLYNLNTNIFLKPVGQPVKHYSNSRFENHGFNQLENYLSQIHNFNQDKMITINKSGDLMVDTTKDLAGKDFFIYDPTLNWFASLWYFRRWAIYYKVTFISAAELGRFVPFDQWLDFLGQAKVKDVYYIWGLNKFLVTDNEQKINQLAAAQVAQAFEPIAVEVHDIYNINNELSFKVYKLKLNN
ncbi:MAG: glycosyltransferase family 39 protein [Patescibacteria group bacterium]|jgi:4-amino-4-deoxy-L-arabinose transferase-like glycosyltransferase